MPLVDMGVLQRAQLPVLPQGNGRCGALDDILTAAIGHMFNNQIEVHDDQSLTVKEDSQEEISKSQIIFPRNNLLSKTVNKLQVLTTMFHSSCFTYIFTYDTYNFLYFQEVYLAKLLTETRDISSIGQIYGSLLVTLSVLWTAFVNSLTLMEWLVSGQGLCKEWP